MPFDVEGFAWTRPARKEPLFREHFFGIPLHRVWLLDIYRNFTFKCTEFVRKIDQYFSFLFPQSTK